MEIDVKIDIKRFIIRKWLTAVEAKSTLEGGLAGWIPRQLILQLIGHPAGRANIAGVSERREFPYSREGRSLCSIWTFN